MADSHGPGDRIISVAERLRHLRFPEQGKLETYWQTLRAGRLVPTRASVDPRAIEDCLEYAFILERIAPGLARFRLAGMHLNDLMGMEVRGMPVTTFFPPKTRGRIGDLLEEVCATPSRALIELKGEAGFGKPDLAGAISFLPLMNDFGDVNRILGALTTVGPIGRVPRRFEVTGVRLTPLAAGEDRGGDAGAQLPMTEEIRRRQARRTTEELSARDATKAGFSEPKKVFRPAPAADATTAPTGTAPPRPAPGKPHLYLVKSDDE